jgi:hypothetical protein
VGDQAHQSDEEDLQGVSSSRRGFRAGKRSSGGLNYVAWESEIALHAALTGLTCRKQERTRSYEIA